ncbi:unnamed protein product (macronuclear) [Paramecium tetraurelia]|uniref:Uncharacterized protein n=1 Tax=Paramecium tetraurelia TaxID=5888 RepID=A0C4Y1_PARTE|nr:uncharacterized protein GSPATT00006347001 [Paramecium tetraurelia]CAK65848.1 unnamed protein product [Paramecium tetraurelia]|eukprot:XP_001433245.1 hypothetical protein (macronuclear) [Paramecium tetraurelia strain d4-2]
MKRPKSAQAQKLSARNKEEILEQKLSPNRPSDQKQSLTKTIKLKVQPNNNDIGDDNQMTRSDLFTRKKSDHFTLFTSFQHKIKLQQNEIDILKQQVQLQQRLAENIPRDFQLQIQQYEEEINRLRSFLEEALPRGSEPKKNQIISYLSKIQEQKGEINKLKLLNDNLQRELEKLQIIGKKQQEQLMKGNQPSSYRKQLNQNENQNDDIKTIQQQFNQQLQEKDKKLLELTKVQQQNQLKLNSYFQNIEQLNSQLQAKQNVIKLIEAENQKLKEESKYIEDQLQEQQENINELIQEKQSLEQNLQQIEQELKTKNEKDKQNIKMLSIIKSVSIFDYHQPPKKVDAVQKIDKPKKELQIFTLKNEQVICKNEIKKHDFGCQCELIIKDEKIETKSKDQLENQDFVVDHKQQIQNSSFQEQNIIIKNDNAHLKQENIQKQSINNKVELEIIEEIVKDYISSFLTNFQSHHQPSQNSQVKFQNHDELAISQNISNQYLDDFVMSFSTEVISIIKPEVDNYLQGFIEKQKL